MARNISRKGFLWASSLHVSSCCSISGGLFNVIGPSTPGISLSFPPWAHISVRNKNNLMSRLVLDVSDPEEERRNKNDKPKRMAVDAKQNKSATDFNLTMGEIFMGKSQYRIAIEGSRMVEEALECGLRMEKLYLLRSLKTLPNGLARFLEDEKQQLSGIFKVPEVHRIGMKAMEAWSSLTTPPGVIGIFRKPQSVDKKLAVSRKSTLPITLICDNIREPGNLGSILRSASGAGCDEVYLSKGCVDPWNMKVIRGASGAHFRLPVTTNDKEDKTHMLMENKMLQITGKYPKEDIFSVLICDSNLEDSRLGNMPSIPFRNIDYTKFSHNFIVIGGETEAITDKMISVIKILEKSRSVNIFRVRIPLANNMDSLNAANAFGIIVFEIVRQLNLEINEV